MPDWPNHGITSTETAFNNITTENTYVQLLAASAAPIKRMSLCGTIREPAADMAAVVYLSTGAGGSEVVRGMAYIASRYAASPSTDPITFFITVEINLPTGTRIAMKWDDPGGTVDLEQMHAGLTVEERAA